MRLAIVVVIALQTFIVGLLLGFYGRSIYLRVRKTYELVRHNMESPPGVVVPERRRVTRGQPINMESETGGIMALTPDQLRAANLKEQNEHFKQTVD